MKDEKVRIAGVTVTFNPKSEIIENALSYLNQVDLLYIIDNSEVDLDDNIKSFFSNPKIRLVINKANLGIAFALNQAAKYATSEGFDFLLTMDQDSKTSNNLVASMIKEFKKNDDIGILSPFVVHPINPRIPPSHLLQEIFVAMTSGSIIKLSVYNEIGGFLNSLFIDYVDYEYSLKTISKGYKIFQLNNTFVYHNLGEINTKRIFSKKFFPTNHSPSRWYYRTRNRFYVYKLYKDSFHEFINKDKKNLIKELIKILLFEDKKFYKYYMILKGYIHFRKNKFGKLDTL
ncbi:MAG: glycosyltransferase family 2 protein [Ignavibacteriaceae bacterium]|jgi:rhamnosyltransferase